MNLQPFLFWVIAGLMSACAIATVVTHNIVRAATWLLFTLAGASALFFLIGADLVGAVQLLVYVGGTMVLVVFGVMLTAEGPFVSMRTSSAEWAVSAATGIAFLAVLLLSFLSGGIKLNPQGPGEAVVYYAQEPLIDPDESGNAAKSPNTMVIGQGFLGAPVGPAHKDPTYRPVPKDLNAKGPDQSGPGKADVGDLDDNLKKLAQKRPEVKADNGEFKLLTVMPTKITPESKEVTRMNYLLPFEIVSVHLLVVLIAAAYLARAKQSGGRP